LYWVTTGYNNPMAFAPIDQSRKIDIYHKQLMPNNIFKKSAKILIRALIRVGFMRLFSPYLLIYAQRKN
jgi:hypothetical protein